MKISRRWIKVMCLLAIVSLSGVSACAKKASTDPSPPPPPFPTLPQAQSAASTSPPAPSQSPQVYPFETVILNASDASNVIAGSSLTLSFSAMGGQQVLGLADFRFQCQRETEAGYSTCPKNSAYTFEALTAGVTYGLKVRAYSISTATYATETQISFTPKAAQIAAAKPASTAS